jgi:hypothetical protein
VIVDQGKSWFSFPCPTHTKNHVLYRRKDCCHPIEKGGVLKYMSILIKISNHLALILPGIVDGSVARYQINAHIYKLRTIVQSKYVRRLLFISMVH